MAPELRLEPPFYLPEIVRQHLPAAADRSMITIADLDSDALCEALNTVLRESIEAQKT
jgi:hypothetical protein